MEEGEVDLLLRKSAVVVVVVVGLGCIDWVWSPWLVVPRKKAYWFDWILAAVVDRRSTPAAALAGSRAAVADGNPAGQKRTAAAVAAYRRILTPSQSHHQAVEASSRGRRLVPVPKERRGCRL